MGLLDRPYADLAPLRRLWLVAEAEVGRALAAALALLLAPLRALGVLPRRHPLTDHYLDDPALRVPAPPQ